MTVAPVIANLFVLATFVLAALLNRFLPDLYYLSVQEDEFLEWATFWGFVTAACIYAASATRQYRSTNTLPWSLIVLALFCLFVALEEISWGQRLLGYPAPEYFLRENYQQEFNLHNVVDTGYRKLAMQIVLLGYGVLFSALRLSSSMRRWLDRTALEVPPPQLIVSFLTMSLMYAWYPFGHTGEWVEFTLALGFVFSAALDRTNLSGVSQSATRTVLQPMLVLMLLAGLSVLAARYGSRVDPSRTQAASLEIKALANDLDSGRIRTRCGIHKRLYTFMQQYGQRYFLEGEFARLLQVSDSGTRGPYLLDPWNSPYWIRHKCDDGSEVLFVYSFGPDRRRNSTAWEVSGDDIGAYVIDDR